MKTVAGIILCGGRSTRMGRPKLALPFGPETLLARVARIVSSVAGPVVVVAAPGQELPELPGFVRIVRDRHEGRGPLEGMLAGLSAVSDESEAAFVTSCDAPLLVPELISCLWRLLEGDDVAVPLVDGFHQPLLAVYRTRVIPHIEALLAEDRLRPVELYDRVPTRLVSAEELRVADPTLASLRNLNRPEEYLAALTEAGFALPDEGMPELAAERSPDTLRRP
jgi:molybdopterin-guanine dinucleotide biosynthesis protein A